MNKWLNKIQTWQSRRELRSLQWWEQERARGKSHFIRHTALTFGLTMAALRDVFNHVFGGGAQTESLLLNVIWYTVIGILGGFFAWSSWETKYKKALLKAHAGVSSSGRALPHSNAKQVSN